MIFSLNKNNETLKDFCLALILASLPLPFGFINVFVGLFCILTLFSITKNSFQLNKTLLLPLFYYIICVSSLLWTIDVAETSKYLSKSIFFVILPVLFFITPKLSITRRDNIFTMYSYMMVFSSVIYLIMALFRYIKTKDINNFFYHELVTLDVNAIYVSLFVSFAFICLLNKSVKKYYDYISLSILFVFLILLSSKNVIVITLLGMLLTLFKNFKLINKRNLFLVTIGFCVLMIPISSKIYERFQLEFVNGTDNIRLDNGTINVSLKNAWEQEDFAPNYYFNGSSFRLYQIRVFKEIMSENDKFLSGFGPSTVQKIIIDKQNSHHLYQDYNNYNFHNQFLQTFSTIGIFGFIILLLIHSVNWIKSITNRDLIFLFFTILSISIMFTESLFERQRGIIFFVLLFCILNHTYQQKRVTN